MEEDEVIKNIARDEALESPISLSGVGSEKKIKEKKPKKILYFFDTAAEVAEWRDKYYRDERVLFLMVPYMAGRETALISSSGQWATARHMKIHNVVFLKSNFNAYDFFNKDYMIYYSLASYLNHPLFSYAPAERQRQQREWVDGVRNEAGELVSPPQMSKYIMGFDILFDHDAHGKIYSNIQRSEAYRDCRALRDFLRKCGVKYRIIFSGTGFHLTIPWEQFKDVAGDLKNIDFMQDGTAYNFVVRVRERIVNMLGLGSVDLTIVDAARVAKVPYSMTKSGTVALPFANDSHFDVFDVNSTDPRKVLARTDLYMRGIEWTNQGSPSGFQKMLKAIGKW